MSTPSTESFSDVFTLANGLPHFYNAAVLPPDRSAEIHGHYIGQTARGLAQLYPQEEIAVFEAGTGSGICMTAALCVAGLKKLRLVGVDISPAAIDCTQENVRRISEALGVTVKMDFTVGDWNDSDLRTEMAAKGPYHITTANVPFKSDGAPIRKGFTHAPAVALFGGKDGLDHARVVGPWLGSMISNHIGATVVMRLSGNKKSLSDMDSLGPSIINESLARLSEEAVDGITPENQTNGMIMTSHLIPIKPNSLFLATISLAHPTSGIHAWADPMFVK